ncbi:barstar family protein [Streptomyces sp. NPDC058872]|uniref:barstar family protein n=1 Tax=Streptomyces sp. NPDC058872 TaxID=3346661 RepID=UPI00369BB4D6
MRTSGRGGAGQKYALTSDGDDSDFRGFAQEAEGLSTPLPADAPAGQVFTLGGRHIVDRDAFYCAIGEVVNGPGGYFGWNPDALDDCLRGGWGATAPSPCTGTSPPRPGRGWRSGCPPVIASLCCSTSSWRPSRNGA